MTKRFESLIHVIELCSGKIEIYPKENILKIVVKNCNQNKLNNIIDYIFEHNFKILNYDVKKFYYLDIKNTEFIDIDLEKNYIDLAKFKTNNYYIPISNSAYKSLWKLKERASTWNNNDFLYWSEG